MRSARFCALAIAVLLLPALSPSVGAQQAAEKKAPSETVPPPAKFNTAPATSQLQGFSVVLLLGDMQTDAQDSVPAAARRALADMKDFLPYKGYRLLDTQWVLCCSGSTAALTRLRGAEEQEYELEVRGTREPGRNDIFVRFVLREPNLAATGLTFKVDSERSPAHPKEMAKSNAEAAEISREIFQLERERADLTTQLSSLRGKVEVGMTNPDEVKRMEVQLAMVARRISELKQTTQAAPPKALVGRAVIDTSFRMEEGETVVVGSSGVKGGKRALIALLTAAAPTRSNKK